MPSKVTRSALFEPRHAQHFDLINSTLNLTADEVDRLQQNRFVVTDRLTFNQFKRAYAWIYWKDLPVLVTTDAILHSIHQTYDEMLKQVEITILTEKLITVLSGALDYLKRNHHPTDNPQLAQLEQDLALYLSLPLSILSSPGLWSFPANPDYVPEEAMDRANQWLEQIGAINRNGPILSFDYDYQLVERNLTVGIEQVTFFGLSRSVDFTHFRARGHYDEPPELVKYFCAMMWLHLLDFRLVEFDGTGTRTLHRNQIAGAFLLAECIEKSGQKQNGHEINDLLSAFVGWSDNITLNGLERFFADADISNIDECLTKSEAELFNLLTENDYGQQRVRGQYQQHHLNIEGVSSHNISFMLMGQRYTIESDIMQQLVYDKLVVDGKSVPRPYPSPFDVLYALGNDRALAHLQNELDKYGYEDNLNLLRDWVSTHSNEFWENSFYNHWLQAICTLNTATISDNYPLAMQSSAWADKMLQTQLGSWTELRHDNILYVKPPHTIAAVCDYPVGYVEPYPDFYHTLQKYAEFGHRVFKRLNFPEFEESYEDVKKRLGSDWSWTNDEIKYRPQKALSIQQQALTYFKKLAEIMTKLEELSHKELSGAAFSEEDNLFLRSIVVRKYISDKGYGGWTEEHWDGWYIDLLPFGDQPSQLVADIHTNYNANIGDIGVFHIGLDNPVMMLFAVEAEEMTHLFVGPTYTVYEHVEKSSPPYRMTDDDWHRYVYRQSAGHKIDMKNSINLLHWHLNRLQQAENPDIAEITRLQAEIQQTEDRLSNFVARSASDWTQSFRIHHNTPERLDLPPAYADFKQSVSQPLQDLLDSIHDTLLGITDRQTRSLVSGNIGKMVEIITQNPEKLFDIEGMTDELFDELLIMLKSKGHIQ